MLNSASIMELTLRFQIACMCFLGRRKLPEMNAFFIHLDRRDPPFVLFVKIHSKVATGVVRHGGPNVLTVYRTVRFPQIAQPIIRSIAVDMINFTGGPSFVCQKEREPMALDCFPKGGNPPISLTVQIPRDFSYYAALTGALDPFKNSGLRIIRKIFRKTIEIAKIKISHNRTPNAVLGQGRALLKQRFRPAFYAKFLPVSQGIAR